MQRLDPSFGTSTAPAEPARSADRHLTAVQKATAILARQLPTVFVAVLVSALAACIALLALDARHGMSIVLDQMIGATKVVVFLNPQVSPQESETIGAKLKAEPGVGAAQFRSKEEAWAGVSAEQRDGTAPKELVFPDAWILSLHAPDRHDAAGERSLVSSTERLQRMAAALPGVESVRFDRVWITELERWTTVFRTVGTAVWASILGALGCVLFGTYFLANRAMRGDGVHEFADENGFRTRVFTYIGFVVAAFAGIATFVLHALVAFALSQFVTSAPSTMQTWLSAFGQSRSEDTLAVAAAILVTALIAAWLATRRQ